MKYLLSFALLVILLSINIPTSAADPCDPDAVIAQANALKSSGDAQKDLAALIELSKAIQAANSTCLSCAEIHYASAGAGTRKNPIPLDATIKIDSNGYQFEIKLAQIIRGVKANAIVAENSYNDAPREGMEYLLALVHVNYKSSTLENDLLEMNNRFLVVSNQSLLDPPFVLVLPGPSYPMRIFPEAEAEAWIGFQIHKNETHPLVFWNSDLAGDGLFFATW